MKTRKKMIKYTIIDVRNVQIDNHIFRIADAASEPVDTTDERKKLSSLSDWFTWCQTCRHGGHADHMTSWFKGHAECPVTGCGCKCNTLDTVTEVSDDRCLVPVT